VEDPQKREFDALQALQDQSWSEFQEKSQVEWRLSFGIWSAMVAAIGGILAGKAAEVNIAPLKPLVACLFSILLGLHLWFLIWVQQRLQEARENLRIVRQEMWNLLDLVQPGVERNERKIYKQPSLYVQLGITCVLEIVLLALLLLA